MDKEITCKHKYKPVYNKMKKYNLFTEHYRTRKLLVENSKTYIHSVCRKCGSIIK
jgi:adenylosuccinate synthase